MTGDAGDERAQDQWRDDDFDQAEENVTEEFELRGKGRGVETEFEAGEHGEENPEGESAFLQASEQEQGQAKAAERAERPGIPGNGEEQRPRAIEKQASEEQEPKAAVGGLWHARSSGRMLDENGHNS